MTTTENPLEIEVRGDTVELRSPGHFDIPSVQQVVAAIASARAQHTRVFVLAAGTGNVSSEARKYITEWMRTASISLETAVWGGSAIHRAIAEMIFRGARLFRPDLFVVTFHRTREEAIAWIDARRQAPGPT